jgi:hypothetical protein
MIGWFGTAEEGMQATSKTFLDLRARVYVDQGVAVKEANKAL